MPCGNEFRDLNLVLIVLVLVLHFGNISICIIFCGHSIQIYLIGPLNVTSSLANLHLTDLEIGLNS